MTPISSLSRIYVTSFITGASGAEAVEIAFLPNLEAEPEEVDWRPGSWGQPAVEGAPAQILIGPGAGAVTLLNGTYAMWVRVTGPIETPVFLAGLVPIT